MKSWRDLSKGAIWVKFAFFSGPSDSIIEERFERERETEGERTTKTVALSDDKD